ncbi:ATP-binding protein [Streptomyces sp. NPDC052114]|uniref:ATP-binding protein n=1 Tax=unclassified Streptomyces TaxID=2593676 RepID=UPI00343ADD59
MIYANECARREPWVQRFSAEPHEVAGLRRTLKLRLTLWGLPDVVEAAQICVAELASNVIRHVGEGTAVCLTVAVRGAYLRIEMRDSDARALPTLLDAAPEAESGRGMAVVDAVSKQRWGVILCGDSKTVWCEVETGAGIADVVADSPRVARAAEHLLLYGGGRPGAVSGSGRVGVAVAEEVAIDLIADLLHWLQAHGCDPDDALDRAQMHFEAESGFEGAVSILAQED